MSFKVERGPRCFTVDEFLSDDAGLPAKTELIDGVIGPFSRKAKLTLLANWGADAVIKLTGPEIWREALKELDARHK